MPEYLLTFDDDDIGEPKRVEFTGDSPAAALTLLENEGPRRQVKLWEGDKLLGALMRDRNGVWHLDEPPMDGS
ncbi:hypothetical protein [Erythrobacter sp.]|uniref:hypothetical protein n=1 Tax=Erythrobacter sp. TaxID=1042 RepID=UPI001B0CA141|nr:hypothetical protein [Erythrobacter sp.]MBO6527535.1 hypothetical protein [Erythrobacter sp.]MBO6530215.1 hypothetical protein [Erythrobacter sp.]